VGRTPRSAADALVGYQKPDPGVRRGRGRPPHPSKKCDALIEVSESDA